MKMLMNIPETGYLKMVTLNHSVVGKASFGYFDELFSVIGYDKKLQIDLKHEPDNPVDVHAIRCYAHGIPIGYLVHQDAVDFNFHLHLIKRLSDEGKIRFYCNFYDFNINRAERCPAHRILVYRVKKV